MRKVFAITIALVLTISLSAQSKKTDNKFLGNWTFTVANAPYEYASGKAEFKTKNDSTFVTLRLKEFSVYDLDVDVKSDKATILFETEDEDVVITLTEKEGKLSGTAKSPSVGELKVNMLKEEKEEEK